MSTFDAGGSMPGGSYIKWRRPCTYPRDAKGRWAGRKSTVKPQTADANRGGMLIDWPPNRTVTVLQPNVDARIVRVKFVLAESSAKQLLLNLAVRYAVKRYYDCEMPTLTVVLEGPEFNLIGLVGKYSELYDKLSDLLRDTGRKFFDQTFGRGCHRPWW